ncbi:MAG: FMN-binding protein [Candidatus Nanopelagicales bacterium]
MRALRRRPVVAAIGGLAVAAPLSATLPAHAAPNPGQTVENDYGQTDAEVDAEVAAAVSADPAVRAARARVASAHAVVVARATAEAKAKKTYAKARKTHKKKSIAKAKRAYKLARSRTAAARSAEASAASAAAAVVAQKNAAVRWMHYRPVDGVWQGARSSYYIPDDGKLHPIEVRITVSGGHVVAVSVPVSETSGETGRINESALPVLIERALAAGDTAEVASVSGASLTSYAFRNSLSSALLRAGYHA